MSTASDNILHQMSLMKHSARAADELGNCRDVLESVADYLSATTQNAQARTLLAVRVRLQARRCGVVLSDIAKDAE